SSPSTCPTPLSLLFFFFKSSSPPRDLHSFPTRRSSDLIGRIPGAIADAPPLGVVDEVLDRLAVGAFEFEQDELPRVAGLHAGGQPSGGRVRQTHDDRLLVWPAAQRGSARRVVRGVAAGER